MAFWAHSDPAGLPPGAPDSQWQPLAQHLQNTAGLARRLAEYAAPEYSHFHDLAERCGLLHDYGKYADSFQRMILTGKGRCPHAIYGAAMAQRLGATHICSAIAGHHAGMPDLGQLRDKVKQIRVEADELLDHAGRDPLELGALFRGRAPSLENPGDRFDLLTRMLLSCLVDADRLDTARRPVLQAPLDAANRLELLLAHVNELARQSLLDDGRVGDDHNDPTVFLGLLGGSL